MCLYCACGVNKQHLPVAPTCPFCQVEKMINREVYSCAEAGICCVHSQTNRLGVVVGPCCDESLLSDSYTPHVLPTGCFAFGTWMVFSPVCLSLSRILPSGRESVAPADRPCGGNGADLFGFIFDAFGFNCVLN